MDPTGLTGWVTGRRPGDHLCWPYRGPHELVSAARDYVAEGLDRGEMVACVADGTADVLREELARDRIDERAERGQLLLTGVDAVGRHDTSGPHNDEPTAVTDLLRQARRGGYTGLRLFADGTALAAEPSRLPQQVRYEHLVDGFRNRQPYTALCAYDIDVLGVAAAAQLSAVHQLTRWPLTPFHVGRRPAGLTLSGSVDAFSAGHLERVLACLTGEAGEGEIRIDAASLTFAEHRALLALDRYGHTRGASVVLQSPPPLVDRLADLLTLSHVRIEVRHDC